MNTPAFRQLHFRFRDNDGTDETDATWRQSTNDDDTQDLDTTYRVRFSIEETAGFAANNQSFQLEYQVDGGGYVDVDGASSNVRAVASNLVDGDDTTQQISSPRVFQGGDGQSTDGSPGGPACDFIGNDTWECEISYQLRSADLSGGEVVDLRIAGLDAYTVADGTITVNSPGGSRRIFVT